MKAIKPFEIISGPMGSGKSHVIEKMIEASDEKFVIATQLTSLSDQYAENFLDEDITAKAISLKSAPNGVGKSYLRNRGDDDLKVLMGNQTVVLAKKPDPDRILIMDEVPTIFSKFYIKNKDVMTTERVDLKRSFMDCFHTDLVKKNGVEFCQITASLDAAYTRSHDNQDAEEGLFQLKRVPRRILDLCINQHYSVMALKDEYDTFNADETGEKVLNFYCTARPSLCYGWKKVVFLGANFQDSLLYKIWSKDADFIVNTDLQNILRFQDYSHKFDCFENGNLFYVTDKMFSKSLITQVGPERLVDAAAKAVQAIAGDAEYIYCLNNNMPDWTDKRPEAIKLSPDPRGLRQYAHIHTAAHLAALNLDGFSMQFLRNVHGITHNEVRRAVTWERVSQFLGRTSMRDPDSKEPVNFIVGDLNTAEFIQELTGRKKAPEFLDLGIDELVSDEPKSDSARSAARYARDRVAGLAKVPQYEGFDIKLWDSLFERHEWSEGVMSWDDVVSCLRTESKRHGVPIKENNKGWREGIYENHAFTQTKLIILDIDKMNVSPNDISNWLISLGLTHVMHHTNRATKTAPRVRVVIPMSHSITETLYKHIVRVLTARADAHFGEKGIVLDKCSSSIKVPLFVPNISPNDADLFIEYTAQPLNAVAWLEMTKKDDNGAKARPKPKLASSPLDCGSETDVEAIIAKHEIMPGQSGGHDAMFAAAGELHYRARVPLDALVPLLHQHANRFGTAANRSPEGVVASLRKYKRVLHAA